MSRSMFMAVSTAVVLAAFSPAAASAQAPGYVPGRIPAAAQARPIYHAAAKESKPKTAPLPAPVAAVAAPGGYPQLHAPLYPCPTQRVPVQIGGTLITNPALYPHEMLYEHTYRAVYPPFYYNVKGSYFWTPFGMRSAEKWELEGTTVTVKYRSRYGLFSSFIPPYVVD